MRIISSFCFILLIMISCSSTKSNVQDNTNPKVRLSINVLKAEGVESEAAEDLTLKLYNNLKKYKGEKYILYRKVDGINESANRQLIGNISKLGNSWVLTVKVVEGEKNIILFNKTKMVSSIKKLNREIDNIAEAICDEGKIWQI